MLNERGHRLRGRPHLDQQGSPLNPHLDHQGRPVSPHLDQQGRPLSPHLDQQGRAISHLLPTEYAYITRGPCLGS